jgi:hypothetical protein
MYNIKIRYWFTREGTDTLAYAIDTFTFTIPGDERSTKVTGNYVNVSADKWYFEIGFTSDFGTLPPAFTSGEMQVRLYRLPSYPSWDQSNDYSFDPAMTTYQSNTKVTAYLNGVLMFGTEPTP